MSHDTQNLVGGILIIVSLIGLEWWQYKMGVSAGPWPFQSLFRYLFWPSIWMPAAYRERDPRSFWLNLIWSAVRILVIAVITLGIVGYLHWPW